MFNLFKKNSYTAPYPSAKNGMGMWFVFLTVFILVAGAGYFLRDKIFSPQASPSKYQAVFLANGQVYFGSLAKNNSDYLVLKDIYYLQAVQPLQGVTAESQPISLVKLGKELHGPEDVMYINRSQVLFYEDLRSDSNIVQKMEEYKKNPAQ